MTRTDQIVHAETRSLLAYWDRLRAGRVAPFRIEVDPRDMMCEARRLFIIEARRDGSHRFRLAGSEIIDTLGMELRGQSVKVIMEGQARDSLSALIAETLDEPGIGYCRLKSPDAADENLWEMLLLPLRSENGTIDRLIGVLRQLIGIRQPASPLRFTVDDAWIQPIEVTDPQDRSRAVAGFAEEQIRFDGPDTEPRPVQLTAIEGGRPGDGERGVRPKPALRLIKDD